MIVIYDDFTSGFQWSKTSELIILDCCLFMFGGILHKVCLFSFSRVKFNMKDHSSDTVSIDYPVFKDCQLLPYHTILGG